MIELVILGLIITLCFIRKVPNNTVIIIDRNTHYLKTKKRGFYFFNPSTDKITTEISTNVLEKFLTETFETEDGLVFPITIKCSYFSNSVDNTLDLLESSRRSIDDIILSAIYSAVGSLKAIDVPELLDNQVVINLKKELISFDVSLNNATLSYSVVNAKRNDTNRCFKPHVSSSKSNGFAIQSNNSFNGPIQYK